MKLRPRSVHKREGKVAAADWKSSLRSARRDRTLDSNCPAQPPHELTVQISSPSLASPVSASELLQRVHESNLCDAVKEPLADALIPGPRLYNAGDLRARGALRDGFRALRSYLGNVNTQRSLL